MGPRWLLVVMLLARLAAAETAEVYAAGTIGLAHQLKRLQTTARVLHIGAHPDDEDTALLAALARGYGARAAYLSLNRGEGGQNGIGPELEEALGLLRTEELLAARRIDGAEQYFTTAFDFGFSKTAEESLAKWGEEAVLAEVVALVRRFRPQVMIARFTGESADGHGHHQVAGLLARRAFRAAGDPAAYPEQIQLGLPPWQPAKLYLDRYQDPGGGGTRIEAGAWSPIYGRGFLAMGMESRSQHRSQDMGRVEPKGALAITLRLVDQVGRFSPTGGIFDGLDTALPGAAGAVSESSPAWQREAQARLVEAAALIQQAQALYAYNLYPRQTAVALAKALRLLRRAHEAVTEASVPLTSESCSARLALTQKVREAEQALALSTGLQVEALADRPYAVPRQEVKVAGQVFWHETTPVSGVRLDLRLPEGWSSTAWEPEALLDNLQPPASQGWVVKVPPGAAPTQPYWLTQPREGERYRVDDAALRGLPLAPPPLSLQVRAVVEGEVVTITQPVQYRWADPRRGERRREVEVRPLLEAALSPRLRLLRAGSADPVRVTATVDNHGFTAASGRLALRLGDSLHGSMAVELPAGGRREVKLEFPPPRLTATTAARLVWLPEGAPPQPLASLHELDYEHVRPRLYLTPAELTLAPVSLAVAARRVGYVPGPGDDLLPALRELGVDPLLLEAARLANPADWAELRTIVVGARAYETNEALRAANPQLLAWARAGGSLVVMYQKYPFAVGELAPYPFTYDNPHDRVVDETAPVTLLQPEHPLLTSPNRLGEADFEDWVQERGLYFWDKWDAAYTPLLASGDRGEAPQEGGLLAAPLGEGSYVYCAYALFRQLPAGVPGAYRLLANLLAYGPGG